ncbi:hypothetical protein D3C87_475290 [compost metagenome]
MSHSDSITLKLTSAIVLGGNIHRAGRLVEVSEPEARNLLDRGKAVLATEKTVKTPRGPSAKELEDLAAQEAEDAAVARAMKDNELDEPAFLALSNTKRNALVKAAHEAIAKDAA